MIIRKPVIVSPKILLSLFLSWAGALATAFAIGLKIG